MRGCAVTLSILTGVLLGLYALLSVLTGKIGHHGWSIVICLAGFALAFQLSGLLAAWKSRVIFMRTVWALALGGYIWLLIETKPDAGPMDGGLFLVMIFLFLVTGLVTALFAPGRMADKE